MAASEIVIQGARQHNLRNVSLRLPKNRLICFTGVSGSGKSSLAFDTLFAEGQRRYVESLSTYARQFLGQMPRPDVDLIEGLSPTISISQKTAGINPRSTVGTITEIYDFLRLLYARVGRSFCPDCGNPITAQTRQQITQQIADLPAGTRWLLLAPVVRAQKGEFRDLFAGLLKQGFVRARVDGAVVGLSDRLRLDRQMRHNIEVVVDRVTIGSTPRARLAEAVELALKLGNDNLIAAPESADDASSPGSDRAAPSAGALAERHFSARYACVACQKSFEPPSPQLFSFNSPQGMCPECRGLGQVHTFDPKRLVPDPSRSFQQGAVVTVGRWRDLGRWRRHIFRGVAETLERNYSLAPGTVLETAWEELDPKVQHALLWGTGELHITFTWRSGPSGYKWGGTYEGIIPRLQSQYHASRSRLQRQALEKYMDVFECPLCHGQRLNRQACAVTLATASERFSNRRDLSLPQLCELPVCDAAEFLGQLHLDETGRKIAAEALKEILARLQFLENVGLDYITLDRSAPTLAGGEMQRIRLAGQIGSGLVGVLYILDEPSIGLHPRDNRRLLATLRQLRDQGNTVVVVEHDEETIRSADHVVDFGPGPGVRGGHVVASGPLPAILAEPASITGQYLAGRRRIEVPQRRRLPSDRWLVVRGAAHNNLKNVDVRIPLGVFVCVTGVSGSGKSSLVSDILVEALRRDLNAGSGTPGAHQAIEGLEHLDKMIAIDQSPIGRTPRSNPATYIKLFDEIRRLYAQLPDARARGYQPGRFSFNLPGGRCEACEGNGANKLEMDFLADIWVTCPVCNGRRFNRETLQVRYKGKSIADVLDMDVQEALEHFANVPKIRHPLQTLHDVGLDYMKLGQPSPTLSGGEAQRVKLARELVKRSTGRTLYLLDEPTTGLHFADVEMLLRVLHDFVDEGNTVLVVEHNLEVVKTADWIIDLGPEGGQQGGQIVAAGPPEQVAVHRASHTGRALRQVLNGHRGLAASPARTKPSCAEVRPVETIRVRGASEHNLRAVNADIPRDKLTAFCGPSGSGKTSLAMDTIYAEGQRRYVESLSAYARQFVGQLQKPRVEHVDGLSPALAIEQKHLGHTPRSTVGTATEIYDYLRVLMARLGRPYCPECNVPIGTQSVDEIVAKVLSHPEGTRLYLMAPLEPPGAAGYEALFDELRTTGYARVRVDGETCSIDRVPPLDRRRRHSVEVVVDRVTIRADARRRVADSVENALSLGRGAMHVAVVETDRPEPQWQVFSHSQHYACERCGRSFEPLSPHHFSFNSPLGWCPACEGLGVQTGADPAALLRDPKLTLAQGAVALFPESENGLFGAMLRAFSRAVGIPLDVPLEQLGARHRRLLFHGTGEQWIEVSPDDLLQANQQPRQAQSTDRHGGCRSSSGSGLAVFRFQFKGLHPALEEASRLVPGLRSSLTSLIGEVECSVCAGSRLRPDAAAVQLRGQTIDELCRQPLGRLIEWFGRWEPNATEQQIGGELLREIRNRLQFLVDVGLDYLTLARTTPTLSGGEMQRIRLAAQLGSGLCGVTYVLDEPTIGLHPHDNHRLLTALKKLRDLGNTLLVVEHDREVLASADFLLDFGPGAGRQGGNIVACGTPAELAQKRRSVTGPYLAGKKAIPIPSNRRMSPAAGEDDSCATAPASATAASGSSKRLGKSAAIVRGKPRTADRRQPCGEGPQAAPPGGWLEVRGARQNNLRNIDVRIPLGTLTVVTGTSGSGKSSLVDDILYQALARDLHRAQTTPGAHDEIRGLELIDKVIRVDQQPLGQTPTSNPATYTGLFDLVRELFAQLPEAKVRGFTPRRFSFNVPGGRCEKCQGNGQLRVEMHFLPDVWITCEACKGRRYEPETLAVQFHGQSIADVLDLSCGEALRLFENIPRIRRILQTLCDVGLGYLALGQPAPTLSGGEAQRVKLAAELARPQTGRTLYLLDEPTTGLHFDDLAKLLEVLNRLVDLGNTVLVIEHNLDVIKSADWVIDLGPGGGDSGGWLVAAGTPEQIVEHARRWRLWHDATAAPNQNIQPPDAAPSDVAPAPEHPPAAGRGDQAAPLRSYTGEVLEPVLAAGPYRQRKAYDPAEAEAKRPGDVEISELGSHVSMPWEIDGRRWHTELRRARNGNPCRWDGRILAEVVDRIEASGLFAPTEWNNRSVVQVCAAKKSLGWFFHAITAEEWLLKLKFRTARNTFRRDELVQRLDLKPLNEMSDIPLYGREPRVSCKTLRGPWQEVELRVHSYGEIDRPEFWQFVDQAIGGFGRFVDRARVSPEEIVPWKVLGRKWHVARRGFPLGKPARWQPEVLDRLFDLLEQVARHGTYVWTHKQVVPLYVPGQREPWAAVQTKKPDAVYLTLMAPRGRITRGRLAQLPFRAQFREDRPEVDQVRLRFRSVADVELPELAAFLREHLRAVNSLQTGTPQ